MFAFILVCAFGFMIMFVHVFSLCGCDCEGKFSFFLNERVVLVASQMPHRHLAQSPILRDWKSVRSPSLIIAELVRRDQLCHRGIGINPGFAKFHEKERRIAGRGGKQTAIVRPTARLGKQQQGQRATQAQDKHKNSTTNTTANTNTRRSTNTNKRRNTTHNHNPRHKHEHMNKQSQTQD